MMFEITTGCYINDDGYVQIDDDNTGYGTFVFHDPGLSSIHDDYGFLASSLVIESSGAENIGIRYRTGYDDVTFGDWSDWYTVSEFQALDYLFAKYLQPEIRFTGENGSYISSVAIDPLVIYPGEESVWTDNDHFSATGGFSVGDGSVTASASPVALLHMDGTDGSQTIIDSAERHTFAVSGAPALDTDVKKFGTASLYIPQSGTVKCTDNISDFQFGTNDFKIELWAQQAVDSGYQYIVCKHGGTAGAVWATGGFEWLLWHNNPQGGLMFQWKTSTGVGSMYTTGGVTLTGSMHHIKVECIDGAATLYVDGTSRATGTISTGIAEENGGTPAMWVGSTGQGNYAFNGHIDEVRVWNGAAPASSEDEEFVPATGYFTIQDSGELYCAAPSGHYWDPTTFAESITGAASPTYKYASYDSPQTPTYTDDWLTLAELQDVGVLGRYLYLKAMIATTPGVSFDALSGSSISVDSQPPAVPSDAKYALFETDNYVLVWTEPSDTDFSHCELKRVTDGTTQYLGKVDSLPVWNSDPDEFWQFVDGDITADCSSTNYIDQDVSGTAIAHYICSVDISGNKSEYELFTQGAIDGDFPEPENVLTTDTTNGTTGTYEPDFPDATNVLNTDTVNGTTGRWIPALAASYEEYETFGIDGTSVIGTFAGASVAPSAPTLDSITLSDTTATLSFTGGTDDIYARYRLMNGVADWSEENGTFSRTGSGTVSITGLTNDVAYEFVGYAKNASDAYSTPTSPIFGIPSSGTSDIKKLISAIVAEINTAQILESNGTAIVAEKEIPPRFDSVNNAIIKVFPDSTTSSPIMSNITRNRYRIATCICWRADDSDKIDGMLAARDQLINLLTGKRLTAYTEAFCVGEVEANAFDYDSLKDSQNFICPITFEFQISKRRE
jgi:hypothetical protein